VFTIKWISFGGTVHAFTVYKAVLILPKFTTHGHFPDYVVANLTAILHQEFLYKSVAIPFP